jgi:hypothetical protein
MVTTSNSEIGICRKEEPKEWGSFRIAKYLSKGGAQGIASTSSSTILVKRRSPGNSEHFRVGTLAKYLSKGGSQGMASTSSSEISQKEEPRVWRAL